MTKASLLLIEDDPDIVELLRYNLEREGFSVRAAASGEDGLAEARRHAADLVVLDLMLPGIDGLEVCRRLKTGAETRDVAVVMLTAKGEEADVVTGLELGADDYLTKPFSPRELVARVRAVLRRRSREEKDAERTRIQVGSLAVDATRHEVLLDGEPVPFTRSEFRLLWALLSRPGRVFTRNELADKITGGETLIIDRNVDVHVSAIRKKLGAAADLIATVRGVGYKCKD